MRKLTVMLLACLMMIGQVWAQTRTVTGTVRDEQGEPIAGASVTVKGTEIGTTTNAEGKYTLSVPANARTIVISTVGYASQEYSANSANITATLKTDDKSLTEVVVTGYTREKKSTFSGAATVLSGKIVENVPVGAFDQALQGRAAGVQVQSASGQPGSSASITIRGISSIQGAGAQPLFVIDGVPMPSGDMQSINPNDFESITILKDASAAALYGARGGLGVVVITTKKGRAGQTKFSFRSSVGFTQAPNATNFDMMSTQEIFEYEERLGLQGAGITGPGWAFSSRNPTYANQTPAVQARRTFLRDSLGAINSNWGDIFFRQGFSQNHELNLSGGSDKTRFFLSMGMFDQEGTDLRSRLRRYSTRFNIDHTVGKLTVGLNALIGYSILDLNEGEWRGNSPLNPFQLAWRAKPYEDPFGGPNGTILFGPNTATVPRQAGNLLESIENSKWTDNQLKMNAGLTLAYRLLPTVTLRNVSGLDAGFERGLRGIRANSYIGSLQTLNAGYHAEAFRNRSQFINTSSAIFNKTFNDVHDVEVGGYFEVVRAYNKGFGMQLFNLDPRLEYTGQGAGSLPNGGPQNASSASSTFGIRSYFATGRYTYDDKYTFSANIRRDGTSRILNPANKEITTFSVAATWNAIRENFMSNQSIFSDLKVRASYGSVPNIGSITSNTFGISGGGLYGIANYLGPQLASFGTTTGFGGSPITGLIPTTPGNEDYRIEYIEKTNIGVDFAMFNNRARFTVEAYMNNTKDLFVSQPTPYEAGFNNGSQPINAGTMQNKGLEFAASFDIIKSRNSLLTFSWNHSINKNEITDLGVVDEYVVGTFIIRKGLPYGSHYTYDYLGADPATGRPTYRTEAGGTTNSLGDAGRFADFGTFLPVHVGGFNLDYRIKKFSIGVGFSYQTKVSRYNNIWNWVTRGTPGYHNAVNASRVMLTDQWEKPGDQKFYQSAAFDRDFTNADIQDAKFLRFRSITLGYDIPGVSIGGNKVIQSARFYAQMFNVWVWSPWKGPDPEDNNNISLNEFPNPRAATIGLEINF